MIEPKKMVERVLSMECIVFIGSTEMRGWSVVVTIPSMLFLYDGFLLATICWRWSINDLNQLKDSVKGQ